jgi:iron complex outermembrane receptor protein
VVLDLGTMEILYSLLNRLGTRCAVALAGATILLGSPTYVWGQDTSATLSGKVTNARSAAAVSGARVVLEETGRETTSDTDGEFTFRGVRPGTYHIRTSADGFAPARVEVVASADSTPTTISLQSELHYSEVVSVSPSPRDPFESYQPASVLSGQELSLKLEGSLGELLKTEPGVADRAFGPGPSRPVIRGLDGDRVLIMENGQRTDDLSSQSGDHGVVIMPLGAERVEIVRGPATLLYGANAIGGLVNVVSDIIPTRPITRTTGEAQAEFGTAAEEAGTAGELSVGNGKYALHGGGGGRRSGDVGTPLGDIENSQTRTGFGHAGGSFTGSTGFVGASYQYDDTKYGIPIVEGGGIELTPRRHVFTARGQSRGLDAFVNALRASFNVRRYKHDELDAGEIGTQFKNDTLDFDVMATTRPVGGRLHGTYGFSGYDRSFEAIGEEALSPPVDQQTFGLFTYQEAIWPHVTLQFGGRVDWASFDPQENLRPRDFTNGSASVGALFRPTDQTTVAVSFARAVRNPALEELYFFGPHIGNFQFEIGNADLDAEEGLGVDVSFRWRLARASGEVTWFRNDIDNFVFRNPTGEVEDELPVIEFTGADSVLQGVEAHTDIEVTEAWIVEAGVDYVRGTLKATDEPLPRIPPFRFTGGVRYRWNTLQVGAQVVAAAEQDRVFGAETPTDGYGLLKLFGVYSLTQARAVHTFTARLDNVTNETYRNHLSFIKDLAPEMGRSFKFVYGVQF